MPKFLVENLTEKTINVAIEPWADVVVLAPDEKAEFEYEEPAEIEFSLLDSGPCVGIVSDRIRVFANGSEKIFHPPKDW